MSVGKKSPSLSKWVTGAKLDAASTSTTIGLAAWTSCVQRAGLSCGIFSMEAVPLRQPQGQNC